MQSIHYAQFALCNMHYAIYNMRYIMRSMLCSIHHAHYVVRNMLCAILICTTQYTIHNFWHSQVLMIFTFVCFTSFIRTWNPIPLEDYIAYKIIFQ